MRAFLSGTGVVFAAFLVTATRAPADDTDAARPPRQHRGGLGAVGGGFIYNGPPYYVTVGPDGLPVTIFPVPVWRGVPFPVIGIDRGPLGGPIPPRPQPPPAPQAPPPPKVDPSKADQMITIGDRLFRAQNFHRAEDRYEQAARLDPGAAAPRVRLAQIALMRGQYGEAAERFREAVAADPAWLTHAPDIQRVYGEPREFQRSIARLESHLLVEPQDRDARLVLGAQLYLSGQTRRASDVFQRLTDRKPDAALAAFLDVTTLPDDPAK